MADSAASAKIPSAGKSVKQPKAARPLTAKAIAFKDGRRSKWTPPRIEDALATIMDASPKVADRHWPAKVDIKKGNRCLFINRAKVLPGGGTLFEVCSYVHGHVPESMSPDLDRVEADIKVIELKDDTGASGELVHSLRCIGFGELLIIESARGFGNAVGAIQTLLTHLMRRHSTDKTHPSFVLMDIGTPKLKDMIVAKGGISKVVAKIAVATDPGTSKFGGLLSDTRGKFKGASNCSVTWDAQGTLDTDEAIEALEESEDETLAGVTLYFKNGGSISDLNQYREKSTAYVQMMLDGRIAVSELESEMKEYLDRLRTCGAGGAVTSDGIVLRKKLVSTKKS